MTHKLFELDKMNREQLESIATELNIKGIKKIDSENLAYQILDAEARQESVKPTPEPAQAAKSARRGRPKKAAEEKEQPAQDALKQEKPAAKQGKQTPKAADKPAKQIGRAHV